MAGTEGHRSRHRRSRYRCDAARPARCVRFAACVGSADLSAGFGARLQRMVRFVRPRLVERAIGQARRARSGARRSVRPVGRSGRCRRRNLRVVRRPHVADGVEPVDDRLYVHGHRDRALTYYTASGGEFDRSAPSKRSGRTPSSGRDGSSRRSRFCIAHSAQTRGSFRSLQTPASIKPSPSFRRATGA